MNNFERIKEMNIEELTALLDKLDEGYDNAPWMEWFGENYCDKCEPIMGRFEWDESGREHEFGWCELNDGCKFFPELDDIPSPEQTIRFWLESEVEAKDYMNLDCRKCNKCTGQSCMCYGDDAVLAIEACAKDNFVNYVVEV